MFGGAQGQALSRVYSNLGDVHAGQIVRFVLLDIYKHLDAANQAYFRETREPRFGMTLEQVVVDRDAKLQAFRDSLGPLRNVLKVQPFFGGDTPLYADYAIFGQFQWARAISDFELLAADEAQRLADLEAQSQAKAALLDRLGITADEAKLLVS